MSNNIRYNGPNGGGASGGVSPFVSIQRGVVLLGAGDVANVAINAVDLPNSYPINGGLLGQIINNDDINWRMVLSSNVNINMNRAATGQSTISQRWEVRELNPDGIKSIQRGTKISGSMSDNTDNNIPISAVNNQKCELFYTMSSTYANDDPAHNRQGFWVDTNTNLIFNGDSAQFVFLEWTLVEYL